MTRLRASSWQVRDRWRSASWLGLMCLLACVAAFSTDAGLIYDDPLQAEYGDRVLRWFTSGFRDLSAMHYRDMYLYGGLFDAPAQWIARISPLGLYETRHVLTALCALLGIVACYRFAARIGGARAGFCAGALLFFTPAWTGHGLFNPKDIPFGAAAAFTCSACVAIALGPALLTWRAAVIAGLCTGVALGVRPGGMFLFGYVASVAFARAGIEIAERLRRGEPARALPLLARTALRLTAAAAIAWAGMLIAWPWAQLAPFARPFAAAHQAAHFGWDGDVLFDGHVYQPAHLPRSYLPTWFAMTLPETYLLALLAGIVALGLVVRARPGEWRRFAFGPRALAIALLVAWACAPVLGAVIMRPNIYDGQRHFLFVLPALAALAGIALDACSSALHTRITRAVLGTLVLSSVLFTAHDMLVLHPYEYTYFNRLSGGLPHAYRRFETDYWGASYAAGAAWLLQNVRPNSRRKLRVASCGFPAQTTYYLDRSEDGSAHFKFVEDFARADYLIATTRDRCNEVHGQVLHTIDREDVPLLFVIQLTRPPKRHHEQASSEPRQGHARGPVPVLGPAMAAATTEASRNRPPAAER